MHNPLKIYSKQALKLLSVITFSVLVVGCASKQHAPLNLAESVDRSDFEGKWYVIANIPYFAEKNNVAASSTYLKLGPNNYADIYTFQSSNFENKVRTKKGTIKSINEDNTRWQSTFYKLIKFKFDVLYFNDTEKLMLLGHPSRNYGWVMSQKNTVSDQQYAVAMQIFAENGYDVMRFGKVPQLPEQLGQPEFQIVK